MSGFVAKGMRKGRLSSDLVFACALALPAIAAYVIEVLSNIGKASQHSFGQHVTVLFAAIFFSIGVTGLRKINRRGDLLFAFFFSWGFAYYLNAYKLSLLQYVWPEVTSWTILFLPLLAALIGSAFPYGMRTLSPLSDGNQEVLLAAAAMSIVLAYAMFVYEISVVDIIPILEDDIASARREYTVPFIHVVSSAFLQLGFTLSGLLLVRGYRRYVNGGLVALGVIYHVVTFQRSGLLHCALWIFVLTLMISQEGVTRYLRKALFFFVVAIIVFGILGNIRESARNFSIRDYGELDTGSSSVDWFYAYFAVNMDNLAISLERDVPTYKPANTLFFVYQLLGIKESIENLRQYSYGGKLNLGTGFRDFTLDFGPLFGGIALAVFFTFAFWAYARSCRTEIGFALRALLLVYVLHFPLVNRFAQLIPVFVLVSLVMLDRVVRVRWGISRPRL